MSSGFFAGSFLIIFIYIFWLAFAVCGLIILILLIRVLLLLIRYLKKKLSP